jgi:hypothetical protein
VSYIIHITKSGIYIVDAAGVVNANNANAVWQATWNGVNGAAPIVGGAFDADTYTGLIRDVLGGDVNATVRDTVGGVVGFIGGVLTLPLGPIVAVGGSQAFETAYTDAHNAASAWSQNQDWGGAL